MSTTGDQITTHLPLMQHNPYHEHWEDESQRLMGSMRQIRPVSSGGDALWHYEYTGNSVGIDPSHNDVIFYNGEDTIALHPILSHFQHKAINRRGVIYATRSQQDALSIIHNKEGYVTNT